MMKSRDKNKDNSNASLRNCGLSSINNDKFNSYICKTLKNNENVVNFLKIQNICYNELNQQQLNTIYASLQPFLFQKNKVYQCIDRLDKIISITQSKKSTLEVKLSHIEENEKKSMFDILTRIKQSDNNHSFCINDKSHRRSSLSNKQFNHSGKYIGSFTTSDSKLKTMGDFKARNSLNRAHVKSQKQRSNSLDSVTRFQSPVVLKCNSAETNKREDSIKLSISYDDDKVPKHSNLKQTKLRTTSSKSLVCQDEALSTYNSHNDSPKCTISDKRHSGSSKKTTKRPLSVQFTAKCQLNHSPKCHLVTVKNEDRFSTTKQIAEYKSNEVEKIFSVEIPEPPIIKQKPIVLTSKVDDTETKENSQINQGLDTSNNDLLQKVLIKFDSVKQFIDKHKRQRKDNLRQKVGQNVQVEVNVQPKYPRVNIESSNVIKPKTIDVASKCLNNKVHESNQRHLKDKDIMEWVVTNLEQQKQYKTQQQHQRSKSLGANGGDGNKEETSKLENITSPNPNKPNDFDVSLNTFSKIALTPRRASVTTCIQSTKDAGNICENLNGQAPEYFIGPRGKMNFGIKNDADNDNVSLIYCGDFEDNPCT